METSSKVDLCEEVELVSEPISNIVDGAASFSITVLRALFSCRSLSTTLIANCFWSDPQVERVGTLASSAVGSSAMLSTSIATFADPFSDVLIKHQQCGCRLRKHRGQVRCDESTKIDTAAGELNGLAVPFAPPIK